MRMPKTVVRCLCFFFLLPNLCLGFVIFVSVGLIEPALCGLPTVAPGYMTDSEIVSISDSRKASPLHSSSLGVPVSGSTHRGREREREIITHLGGSLFQRHDLPAGLGPVGGALADAVERSLDLAGQALLGGGGLVAAGDEDE